jgi:hypothetical protein
MSRVRQLAVEAGPEEFSRLEDIDALDGMLTRIQYNFRMHALEGNIPGVKKASW